MDLTNYTILFCFIQVFAFIHCQTTNTPSSPAPEAPTGLKLLERSTSSITLTWTGTAAAYDVRVSSNQDSPGTETGNDAWSYTQSGLSSGTQYEFAVIASSSGHSTNISFYTEPEPPTKLTRADAGLSETLNISWTKPSGGCSIELSISGGQKPEQPNGHQFYQFTMLQAGKMYNITAFCIVGENVTSKIVSEQFYTKPRPVKEINIKDRTDHSITVNWTIPSNELYEKINLELLGDNNNNYQVVLGNQTTNHTFKNLDPGTPYKVQLKTVSGTQESDVLDKEIFTQPEAPSNLAQSNPPNISSISVTWKSVSDPKKISGYSIRLLSGDNVISNATNTNISPMTTAHQFHGLKTGTQYEVDLRSFLQSGDENLDSSPIRANVSTAPGPPKNLVISSKQHTNLSFSWEPPEFGATMYEVEIKYDMNSKSNTTAGTTFQISSDLGAGKKYSIKVYSVKNGKRSIALEKQVVLLPLPPDVPTVSDLTTTAVTVSWTAPTNSEVKMYAVDWKVNGILKIDNATATTYTIKGLSEGQNISIKVFSVNEDGYRSLTSADITSKTLQGVLSVTTESETTTSVNISWSEPAHSTIDRYEIIIKLVSGEIKLPNKMREKERSYHIDKLTPGSKYQLDLKAISKDGGTAGNTTTNVYTLPEMVNNLEVGKVDTRKVQLSWTQGQGVTEEYQIDYSSSQSVLKTVQSMNSATEIVMLIPGDTYDFTVKAISNDRRSESATLTVTTVPLPITNLNASAVHNDNEVTLSWAKNNVGIQDKYQYRYKPHDDENWTNTSEIKVTISSLTPGENYTFEVRAISKDKKSSIETEQLQLLPLAPVALTLLNKSTDSANFTWMEDSMKSIITNWEFSYRKNMTKTEILNKDLKRKELTGLTPGALYNVEVRSISGSLKSRTSALIQVQLKPVIGIVLKEDSRTNTDSITLIYSGRTQGVYDKYNFTLQMKDDESREIIQTKVKDNDDQDPKVTFTGLVPGTVYSVTAVTVSGNETSNPLSPIHITTVPTEPEIGATQQNRSLTLNIKQKGGADYYIISYLGEDSKIPLQKRKQNVTATGDTQINYEDLTPNKEFNFSVVAWKNTKQSSHVVRIFKTEEDKPGKVSDMIVEPLTPNSVKVSWGEPLSPNGIITGYIVSYTSAHKPNDSVNLNNLQKMTIIGSLTAGEKYSFSVSALTSVGEGQKENRSTTTPIWGPRLNKTELAMPQATDEVKDNSFEVSFRNPFDNAYGEVKAYTIIVSTNTSLPDKTPTNWAVAIRTNPMKVYQVIDKCALFDENGCLEKKTKRSKRSMTDEVVFTIGAEDCDKSKETIFCNGPVRPSSQYYVKLRACNEVGNCTDTPYSKRIITAKKSMLLLKILLPIFLIVLAIVVIIAVFIVKRRRKSERDSFLENVYMAKRRKPVESSRPIAVSGFLERVKELSADADFLYSEEFEDLKNVGRDQPTTAAELPVNRNKNRFTNILPYEHSRVKLLPTDDEDGSDYINANYVPGYNSKREFIACQGPLPSTKDDFWRMVWEQNARAIVMLTRCVEKGREKCDHYWPVDSEAVFYGDLQVAILNETQTPEWDIREFTISKGNASRKLTHFHYTAWPDFGVPGQPKALVLFVRLVRQRLEAQGGPIVVHCSAGVGRSGTYISLDTLLHQVKEGCTTVDIFGVVYAMRLQRVCMVQTEQQYICIHNCLATVMAGEEESEEDEPGEDNDGFEVDEGIGDS